MTSRLEQLTKSSYVVSRSQTVSAMELVNFIMMFFASKNLSLLTAFICWSPEELSRLCKAAESAGVRIRISKGSHCALTQLLTADGQRREGMLLDLACPHSRRLLDEASSSRAFNYRHTWLLLHNDSSEATDALSSTAVLPDADVTLATAHALLDVYQIAPDLPLVITRLEVYRNSTQDDFVELWARLPTTVARRKDLNNVYLESCVIVSQPQHFKGWSDLRNRQIDTFPKLTYPLMMLVAEDLNFRYNMRQVDLYGEEHNGSFDGLAGRMQRGETEIGVASIFMRADRWRVLHYCSETVELRGSFLFRQPAQSAVRNVFLLPFSRGVWAASGAVFASVGTALALLVRTLPTAADASLARLTPADAFTFSVGIVCQQGFHVTPALASVRLVMFCALTLSLSAFTAYSAKIVAILQTPSDAIQTIADLAHSPMPVGVQETTYKKVVFVESPEPATQLLYRRKVLPQGDAAFLSVVDGIARVRAGFFAFQVEEGAGYDIISQTYTEPEKCGLKQIQAFKLPMVAVPIRRHSGYRELLAVRLRWQREVGLMSRVRRIWLAERPRCAGAGCGFLSVGIGDVLPTVQVLGVGAAVSVLLLCAELIVYQVHLRRLAD